MTEAEAAAQKRVREAAKDLRALRKRLEEIAGDLPPSVWELDPGDLVTDPDVAGELRRVIQCVNTDRLEPAEEDLLAVASYQPGASGGEEE
jgi:hypothetical protein